MTIITGAPEISLLIIAAGFLFGWLASRYHYKKRLDDTEERLKLRDDQRVQLKGEIEKLKADSERLGGKNKNSQAKVPTLSSSVFVIEQIKWNLQWRGKGEMEVQPLSSHVPVSDDATLVLQIMVRITAIPARVVEDIKLVIAGNRIGLCEGDWRPVLVDGCEQYIYFDIPSSIQLTSHKVYLIAECQGGVEEKSPTFRILLSRSSIR